MINLLKKRKKIKLWMIILIFIFIIVFVVFFVHRKFSNKLDDVVIQEITDKFPYELLLYNTNKDVSNLTDRDLLVIGYYGIDKKGIKFFDCDNYSDPLCIIEELGFDSNNVSNSDKKIIKEHPNYHPIILISKNEMLKIIAEKTGITKSFENSFFEAILSLDCGVLNFWYLESIDLFLVDAGGLCIDRPYFSYIKNGRMEGDYYVLNVVEGYFTEIDQENIDSNIRYYNLSARSNKSKIVKGNILIDISNPDWNKYLEKYQRELDNYKIYFKKDDENYKFIRLEYSL